MIYVLAIIIFIVVIILFLNNENEKQNVLFEKTKNIINNVEDFYPTESFISNNGMAIAYDESKDKICIVNGLFQPVIIDNKDIMSCEIIEDGTKIVKQSTSSTIGKAIVGGAIGGGIGALIGGNSGTKTEHEKIKSIDLKINVNDLKTPFYKINFLNNEVAKDSFLFKIGSANADKWHGVISILINNSSK